MSKHEVIIAYKHCIKWVRGIIDFNLIVFTNYFLILIKNDNPSGP